MNPILNIEKRYSFLKEHFALIFILFISGIVSIIFYTGYYASDDLMNYVLNINAIINGDMLNGVKRFPLLLLGLVSYYIFGKQIDAIPILFSLMYPLIILLVYITVNIVSGKKAAIISALFALGQSTLFIYGGAILPDNLIAVIILCGYLSFIALYKVEKQRNKYIYAIISVFFILLTFMMKEPYLVVFIGFIPLAFYFEKDKKKNIKWALIFILLFVLFYGIYKIILLLLGYPFMFADINISSNVDYFKDANIRRGTVSLVSHVLFSIKRLVTNIYVLAGVIILAVSTVYGLLRKNWLMVSFPAAFLAVFLYLSCGSLSLSEFVGFPIQTRYFATLYVLTSIVIGIFLSNIKFINGMKSIVLIVMIFFLSLLQIFSSLYQAGNIYNSVKQRLFIETVKMLSENMPGYPIYYDAELSRYTLYFRYSKENIKLIRYDKNNNYNFGKGALFISADGNELKENSLFSAANKYAEDKKYQFIKFKNSESYMKNGLKPFIPRYKMSNKYASFWFGYYISNDLRKVELNNSDFEEWEYSLPKSWSRRATVIQDIKKSSDSHSGIASVEIKSNPSLNYIYIQYPLQTESDILELYASAFVKTKGGAKAQLSLSSEYDDKTKNEKAYIGSSTTGDWEKISLSLKVRPECRSVVILISSSGEGSIIADEVELYIK